MKKIFAWFLTLALFASLLCVPSFASAIDNSGEILQVKGTELLEELLSRQFESYKTGQIIDTSDIFLDSQSTQLYNQYLKWYTGLTDATKEYWTNYDFDMRLAGADNDELTFTADLRYTRTCSKYASEQYNFPYTIRITAQNGKYYISEIDTEEANFHDFKGLLANADFVLKRTSAESVVDSLISDYVAFKEKCNNMVVDPADVVDMEETSNAYLAQDNSDISLKATFYSYDGERGRRYADTYIDADMNGSSVTYEVKYNTMSADWPIYKDVKELVEAANVILLGKVTDISFQVLDDRTAQPPSEETEEWNRSLNTIYDVDVITLYKGDSLENVKIRMLGRQQNVRVEEQLAALGEDAEKRIPIMEGMPEIKIGETYLFVLYQYKDTMPTLVNVEQGVYELHDPLAKDKYSFISPKDIISYFGEDKWKMFQEKGVVSE